MTTGFKIIIGVVIILLAFVVVFLKITILTNRVEGVETTQQALVNREVVVASPSATPTIVKRVIVPISTRSAQTK